MLTIEPPYFDVKGITVFRDHVDPDLYYFLPGAPAIAQDGDRLEFTLYEYRRDLTDNPALDPTRAKGAGLALIDVELPPPSLVALQTAVAGQSGRPNARVVPVVFRTVDVHALVAHEDSDKMIADLEEDHAAPIVSPHHAALSLALTAEGATLMAAAARGGQLPVGVAYEMRFLALSPAIHARVTMHYDQIYDHFSASIGFSYYVKIGLDFDLAWLIEHDYVHIDITSFTDDADAARQRETVMNLVRARIQGDFFRQGISPNASAGTPDASPLTPLLGQASNQVSSTSALFVLKAKAEVLKQQKDFEMVYDGRTAVELLHVASANLSMLLGDRPAPDVQQIDLDDPFFSSLHVVVSSVIDFDALADLLAATVTLAHGDTRNSFLISRSAPGPFSFDVPITTPGDDAFEVSLSYDFDQDKGVGPARITTQSTSTRRRVIVVDPLADFRYRRVDFQLGPLDFTRVPRLHLHVRVPGASGEADIATTESVLDAKTPQMTWRLHQPPTTMPLRVMVRVDWEDPSGQVHEGDEVEVDGDSYVALGPYRATVSLLVEPAADWTKTTGVLVEIRYEDGDYLVTQKLSFNATSGAGQPFSFPILDPKKRQYEWRQVVSHADGTTSDGEWVKSDVEILVVGQEKKTTADVQIVWVGAPGDALGLRVDVQTTNASGDVETQSVFLRAGVDGQKSVTCPLDADGKLSYHYIVTKISPSGEDVLRSKDGEGGLLVVQAVAGG